jgi:RNA polymerase sigma-70 factor, ECF subfamily
LLHFPSSLKIFDSMEENRPTRQQYVQNRAAAAPGEAGSLPDDSELLHRSARGDVDAQHALIERHGRYLFGVAHALVGHAEDAEDLVQETFMGAFRTKYRGEAKVRTWLVKILMRRAGMLRRSRGREVSSVSLDAAAEQSSPPAPGSGAGMADAKMDLSVMLQSLSPEHRQVIVLRELQQMSYEEMADALGVPRGTIESRLHRAREELRKRFKGYW